MRRAQYIRVPPRRIHLDRTSTAMVTFAGLAIILAGCATAPPVALEAQDVPSLWVEPVAAEADIWPESEWWRGFGSSELDRLIGDARANNLDLAAATARVLQADAAATIARSALFPWIGVGAEAQRQSAENGGSSVSSEAFGVAGLVGYEADFWGVARNNRRAAEAMLASSGYAREVVALTVTSNVGITYLDILGLRQRLAIARQNLETARRLLSAIERMTEAGITSPLDLAQQQALVAGQEAEIPALEQLEREANHALALMLGRTVEQFSASAQNLEEIHIPGVAPGLPAELLHRRPDIARAEAQLIAAHANVDAARAAFFPSITLTASGGAASGAVSAVTGGPAVGEILGVAGGTGLLYGVGISLLQTIFDGGRLQGQRDLALAEEQELVANYRNTVLGAFSEVETALSRAAHLEQQERLKAVQADSARAAFDISERQYREGLVSLLALLQTQQTLFEVQDQLVQIRLARIQAIVGLYKALGGGWTDADLVETAAN